MKALIEIKDVSKQFLNPAASALKKISAEIPEGKIMGLIGPDGAGKTTLIRLLAGLLIPTEGNIVIYGENSVTGGEKIREIIGYMPQRFGLYEDLTVLQNLNLYADLKGSLKEEKKERLQKLLQFTSLKPFENRLAGNLSGGMKQKLGLACTLIKKPKLLLLDEPSVGVDPISRKELWKMVDELVKEGISLVWSTAYLDEAERCDTVLLLHEGNPLYFGSPKELTKRVEGRTFKLQSPEKEKRKMLQALIQKNETCDATVQGNDIRVVLKENQPSLGGEKIPPRFEDAFIDLLGAPPKNESLLAKRHASVQGGPEIMIEAEKLTKKFGDFIAADQISCSIRKGEIFGLLGPNGAGKSTTFKMLCGLLKPNEGSAKVNGVDLLKSPGKARRHIGYMAQKFSLYGSLTTMQNLHFFAGIYNLSNQAKKEAVNAMVEIFSLRPHLSTLAGILPLGFKQRLSLACATMHDPEILFLDEPTSGVDPITRREFWNHIYGLVEKGVTIMVTTHFMDEAEYCDRIALVYQGKIIYTDTPSSLKKAAQKPNQPEINLEDAFIQLIESYDGK